MGLFRFQKFFFMHVKLMAGLRDSKVRESEMTPLVVHNAEISARKPSLEELDWAIYEI